LALQDLPKQAQKDKKRLLRRMEKEAARREGVAHEKKITKKYHKVKFVDRKKTSRKLDQVERKLRKEGSVEVRCRARRRLCVGAAPQCHSVPPTRA
jgi:hypothetical protein